MRNVPTPERARREASAEPVAPQPTIATRAIAKPRWPSSPMPANRTCREYRSVSSKGNNAPGLVSLYYKCRSLSEQPSGTTFDIPGFIELLNAESDRPGWAEEFSCE